MGEVNGCKGRISCTWPHDITGQAVMSKLFFAVQEWVAIETNVCIISA